MIVVETMNSDELRRRTKSLAVNVISFVETLPRGRSTDIIGKQIIRSATSVAANYRAACRSRSRADFINKIGIVEEEADETLFWIEMLTATNKVHPSSVKAMLDEADQLLRIFAATVITARANKRAK
jgi:four helix bundle protein